MKNFLLYVHVHDGCIIAYFGIYFDINERAFAALQQSVIMYYCPHKKDVDLEYCDFRTLKEFPQGCQI